jgi:hypothetical protein
MSIFAIVILTMIAGLSPASTWEEYVYLDRGVAIQFPARPEVSTAPYQSALVKGLMSTIYTAQDDNVVYKLIVVDLVGHIDTAANLLNEANYSLMREGDVVFNDIPRVYQDERSIYGTTMVVDRPDGSRMRSSLFFSKGHLYRADAIVLPARGDKDMTVPSRFDQTIRFPPDGRFPDKRQ